MPGGLLHLLPAHLRARGIYTFRVEVPQPADPRSWLLLFQESPGELEAVLDASAVGPLRTAAISAPGARFLARPTTTSLGVIGSVPWAWTRARAFCQTSPV